MGLRAGQRNILSAFGPEAAMKKGCFRQGKQPSSTTLLLQTTKHLACRKTLINAIKSVYAGNEFIELSLKEKMLSNLLNFNNNNEKIVPEITQRERQILQLIAEEYTTRQIAGKLFISFRTVENHRYSLLQKLEVKNTIGLLKVAIRLGLVE